MAELVNAYISWQVCEMGEVPKGNLDEIYPIPPLPRVCSFSLISSAHTSLAHPSNLSTQMSLTRRTPLTMTRQAHLASLDSLGPLLISATPNAEIRSRYHNAQTQTNVPIDKCPET